MLAPLARRYLDRQDDSAALSCFDTSNEEPELVRAMPLVLRIERASPPARTPLLEAAAGATLAVCLDSRAAPGGEWHDEVASWVGGRIRKISRRARGAHWAAVESLPGVTVTVDGASVRALVPGLVAQAPRAVSRLQISGTELPFDSQGAPLPDVSVVWLNPGVELTVGKAAAQVGHATMILAAALPAAALSEWQADGFRTAVRVATRRQWAVLLASGVSADRSTVLVRDAGFTEVDPGTVTCAAQRPTGR